MAVASADKVARFRALHIKGGAFLMPNFWDPGSARILEGLAYGALARCTVAELAEAGVARISLGSALASEAYAGLVEQASAVKMSARFDMFGKRREAQAKIRKRLIA